MVKETGRYIVRHTAIGTSTAVFREGDVVDAGMLGHPGQDGKMVQWDVQRLLAVGAIAHTDEDINVRGSEFYAPGPVMSVGTLGPEGEPINAPHPSPTQEANILDAADAKRTGEDAPDPEKVPAKEQKAAADEANAAAEKEIKSVAHPQSARQR